MNHPRQDGTARAPAPGTAWASTPPLAPGPATPPVSRPAPPRLAWGEDQGRLQAVSVWTERVPGRGEDAEPFVAHHWSSFQGLLAVFDGSGGAGAAPAWQAPDGTSRTSAWVGARAARLAMDCWFQDVASDRMADDPQMLHQYLEYFLEKAPQRRSKIGGTMRRQLPTTLAGVHYRLTDGDEEVELCALWAGDSRAYVLLPESGLHVLTRDHTRESDALELLRSDPPMTNLVCADRDFEIDSQRLVVQLPGVLVAATDGFFGYVHTPGDFELLLLQTLQEAGGAVEWAHLLRREVEAYTADDASLALLTLGYEDFADLRAQFAPRLQQLRQQQSVGRPGALAGAPDPAVDPRKTAAEIKAWQDRSWQAYRHGYESHMPPAPEELV
ncbi:protein phosphatase 2C domain-containing protein [Streptomyces kunmingensis]|uniref:Protein phosphatase 2C domain-containing protein n=1 Tax=Streptomyces kunmingensis TaxID=68225 RepID=A0ABU6CCS8_9ACTN|nr:serine/threonine protein phosphatase [Streptomyces kunmingensis]MEB3962516.1 protein phosphatase 2C domain-containing protein [Streptomyces kunmingensis]